MRRVGMENTDWCLLCEGAGCASCRDARVFLTTVGNGRWIEVHCTGLGGDVGTGCGGSHCGTWPIEDREIFDIGAVLLHIAQLHLLARREEANGDHAGADDLHQRADASHRALHAQWPYGVWDKPFESSAERIYGFWEGRVPKLAQLVVSGRTLVETVSACPAWFRPGDLPDPKERTRALGIDETTEDALADAGARWRARGATRLRLELRLEDWPAWPRELSDLLRTTWLPVRGDGPAVSWTGGSAALDQDQEWPVDPDTDCGLAFICCCGTPSTEHRCSCSGTPRSGTTTRPSRWSTCRGCPEQRRALRLTRSSCGAIVRSSSGWPFPRSQMFGRTCSGLGIRTAFRIHCSARTAGGRNSTAGPRGCRQKTLRWEQSSHSSLLSIRAGSSLEMLGCCTASVAGGH